MTLTELAAIAARLQALQPAPPWVDVSAWLAQEWPRIQALNLPPSHTVEMLEGAYMEWVTDPARFD